MPADRQTTVDALHLDAVLTLDVDRGVAVIDLAHVSFVDALVMAVLVDRRGERLIIKGAPERTVELAAGRHRTGECSTAWRSASHPPPGQDWSASSSCSSSQPR